MLVFFIHGVATRQDGYAGELIEKIREKFHERSQPFPYFHSSRWGGVLKNSPPLWNYVQQDLSDFQKTSKVDIGDVFQYIQYREFFIDQFFGDLFTYLNPDYGWEIRKVIAMQLIEFLKKYPDEDELHIVAHSLGGVILWDILFSDKFKPSDPAFYIRSVIRGLTNFSGIHQVSLGSITTMGTPLLLFNPMLGINSKTLKLFGTRYTGRPLGWVNIIHASDILAYPIRASFNINLKDCIFLRDKFIASHNLWKKVAQPLGGLAGLSMAKGLESAHKSYWSRSRVARLITANIMGDHESIDSANPFRQWF
ncbi:hypothetical protein H6F98_20715 [Microcoleus sp. FACHB-SPT15]|uniref:hypothetical protein n=1 Tax=Microcoleus sp. FACHB-SPT15 TaxID=2692830 RepID=UPI001784A918|nr:hypothetical protein [Microcoleus sp. FACHB-SPT15]MBD1807854.1 hypothetical protein [Microcoleus sp. FACHB-SPT15]